jgi:hypothetical protein
MSDTAIRSRSPFKFFLLVLGLSVPFWLIGWVIGLELLPGLPDVSGITFSNYYDPRITGLIVAAAALIVTVVWGPKRWLDTQAPERE